MKVAVTGSTGFIGRYVLARLAQESVTITATGRHQERWNGIGHFVKMDITNPPADAYTQLGKPDVLLHLAWDGLPNYRSLHHFETELPRQYAFLKSLIESGLPRLIVVGTCFEYGMQSGSLVETLTTRPANPYGFAKDMLRQQLEYLTTIQGAQLTWARLFYLWGKDQAASSLFPLLTAAVARGDSIFHMSGGEQLRDYLPVHRVADYLVKLVLRSEVSGLINVCSGQPVSVRGLVERWISENHWDISLNLGYYPYPHYEPMAFWGNADKLNELMGN